METRFSLGDYGRHLWTREKAREIRSALAARLDELRAGATLIIDAQGVDVFDYSFANELFGRTILSFPRDYPGRFVIVENLTKYTRENLVNALEGMGIAMIERSGGTLQLIGKVHPADEKTFTEVARKAGPVTAAELSERLKVNLNAMNERLSKLMNLGLVRREKGISPTGREQYEYMVLA